MLLLGQSMLGLVYIVMILLVTFGAPRHRIDLGTSPITPLQLWQAVSWVVGLCVIGILIVLVPLGRGELWAWWTTIVSGLAVFGGYLGPHIVLHRPLERVDRIGFGVLTGLFTLGLICARLGANPA
ncbi:MAG: hypothetical protein ACT4R6_06365 [Gemmatimonadaceae bacterium]